MAFVLKRKESVVRPVVVMEPMDNDRDKKHTLNVEFKLLSVSEQKEWIERLKPEKDEDGKVIQDSQVEDIEVLRDLVIDITGGLVGADGKNIEFSADVLEELADMDYVREPLVGRCLEIIWSKKVAKAIRAKNS